MTYSNQPRILRINEVTHLLGISKSTLYVWIKNGSMVPSISLGGERAIGFVSTEVNSILQALITGTSAQDIKKLVTSLVERRLQTTIL